MLPLPRIGAALLICTAIGVNHALALPLAAPGVFVGGDQIIHISNSQTVALGDVDGDGDADALIGTRFYDANQLWLNNGIGRFSDSGQRLGYPSGSSFEGPDTLDVALADLDGDGDLDAFFANYTGGLIDSIDDLSAQFFNNAADHVWLNDGQGHFSDSGQRLGASWSPSVALADVDSDGDRDAYVVNTSGGDRVYLNNGAAVFSDSGQQLGTTNNSRYAVALGDLDGDDDLDAYIGRFGPDEVWWNDGSGNFSNSGQALSGPQTRAAALGDLDSDGDLDVFIGKAGTGSQGQPNEVWLNNGSGQFSDTGQRFGNAKSRAVALGDVDGDGDLDAFVANDYNHGNELWLNNGKGYFSGSGQSLGQVRGRDVALADLDGDGDLDAFVTDAYAANRGWFNGGLTYFYTYVPTVLKR